MRGLEDRVKSLGFGLTRFGCFLPHVSIKSELSLMLAVNFIRPKSTIPARPGDQ